MQNSHLKGGKSVSLCREVIENKDKNQNIFLLSVFPKESTFSMKSLMSLFIFIIFGCFGRKEKVRKE